MSLQDKSNLMALRISASTVDKARENYVKALHKHRALMNKSLEDGTGQSEIWKYDRQFE